MKYLCTNKRCKHEQYFTLSYSESLQYPLCPCCDSPMLNIEKLVEDETINKMLKNISYYGVKGTFDAIDRNIKNPFQRIEYRKILDQTIKKWRLK